MRAALDAGYFDRLGVTTLWLSPVYTNPSDHLVGRDGHLVAPYHGYWPADPRAVDPQLGGEAALDALVADAHARGLRVLLDVVPNHVFDSAPVVRGARARRAGIDPAPLPTPIRRPSAGSTTAPTHCVCGDPGCDWGAHMESCWFAPYLPDLNWRHPDVVARRHRRSRLVDVALRPRRAAHRRRADDAARRQPPHGARRARHDVPRADADLYVIGETFTGPGDGGRAEIRAYLGDALDGLGGAFDFPLMWAARDAIAHDAAGGFAMLEAEIAAGAPPAAARARPWRT